MLDETLSTANTAYHYSPNQNMQYWLSMYLLLLPQKGTKFDMFISNGIPPIEEYYSRINYQSPYTNKETHLMKFRTLYVLCFLLCFGSLSSFAQSSLRMLAEKDNALGIGQSAIIELPSNLSNGEWTYQVSNSDILSELEATQNTDDFGKARYAWKFTAQQEGSVTILLKQLSKGDGSSTEEVQVYTVSVSQHKQTPRVKPMRKGQKVTAYPTK